MQIPMFEGIIGYILGILIIFIICKVFLKPIKFILKVLSNSIIAVILMSIINYFSSFTGFFIGINPLSALILGLFGVPGLILVIILQILY